MFGGSLEEVEGLGGFGGDGVGGLFEVVGDFEDARSVRGERGDLFGDVGPVDGAVPGQRWSSLAPWLSWRWSWAMRGLRSSKASSMPMLFCGCGEVGVAYVEADADAVEVADAEDFEDVLGRGDFVLQVFDEDADAEGVGEGFEVLDGGEGVFEGAGVPGVALLAEVEDAGVDGNLLGGFEGALDLVHGGDAVGFFGVDEIDVRGDVAGPLAASAVAEVEGLVERGGDAGGAEPGGDVADGGAVAVVEVVAGGEDLDSLGAGFVEGVEQAGVEALLEEDVGGEGGLHHLLRYSRAG